MLFNSWSFLIFLGIVLLIYSRLTKNNQNIFLLVSSYVFYGFWDWRFLFLLFISTIVDYTIGLSLIKTQDLIKRKQLVLISMFVNLGFLGYFKYANFFLESIESLLLAFNINPNINTLQIILPVGISFYTFQTLSYTIGIYRKEQKPTTNFIDFALFVSFFPQLVAGPIERASNLIPQIEEKRILSKKSYEEGLVLIFIGFFRKVAIADVLAPIVDNTFSNIENLGFISLWSGLIAFSIQIYGDFAGYSDIARGVARLLGFKLMKNFEAPYLSKNITEFWHRWHISLSSWLKDYLYIPLGGNQKGNIRTYINNMLTMLLGGLWHGASWNFVIWGGIHGASLAIHKWFKRTKICKSYITDLKSPGKQQGVFFYFGKVGEYIINITKVIFTFGFVSIVWVFFRADNLTDSILFVKRLFIFKYAESMSTTVILSLFLTLVIDYIQHKSGSHIWIKTVIRNNYFRVLVYSIIGTCILLGAIVSFDTITPFIYFQF